MNIHNPKNINPKKFKKLISTRIKGHYYRFVSLVRESEILSTQGSFAYGGRYNPSGEFGALYAGETEDICKAEIKRKSKDSFICPQIIGTLIISLTKVLDLTSAKNLKKINITKEDLIIEMKKGGWELTWQIARLTYVAGYEGIIAPSITSNGNMLVIFDKYIDNIKVKAIKKSRR